MPSEGAKHAAGATQPGDLVRLDYDLWAEGGGRTELIETTHQEVAQEAKVPQTTGRTWGPRPHQIRGDYFPPGVEEALVGLRVGESLEKEFAPGEAFGERDPNLIELFSMHQISRLPEMRREDAHLDIGTVLTIDGRRGRVVSLTQARVRVDFNPPFAGRKLRGKFTVVERIADPADQVRAVIELLYGRAAEFQIGIADRVVTVQVPDRTKFDLNWFAAKPRVVDRIRTQVHPTAIRVVEEYLTPVEKEGPAPPAAEPKPAEPAAPPPSGGKAAATHSHEPARGKGAKGSPEASHSAPAPADTD